MWLPDTGYRLAQARSGPDSGDESLLQQMDQNGPRNAVLEPREHRTGMRPQKEANQTDFLLRRTTSTLKTIKKSAPEMARTMVLVSIVSSSAGKIGFACRSISS